jgi:hypothetical protein
MMHNVESSEKLHKMISKATDLIWEDISYGNDASDSIYNEDTGLIVFLPSPEYPGFLVNLGFGDNYGESFNCLPSTLDYILTVKKELL